MRALLGSSDMVRTSENPLRNVCEKLTHIHKLVEHLGVSTFANGVKKSRRGAHCGASKDKVLCPMANPTSGGVLLMHRTSSRHASDAEL